jgi:CotH kinase protein/Chitobiase/beta-hexosaminidase C-terminal domain/Lamin Tail Domain
MKHKSYPLFAFLLCTLPLLSSAQVVINEYSCANWRVFTNYYLDTEDWVEFYNAGATSVNLQGYYLSDNEDNPKKWAFPGNTPIAAGGFLRVWCSGRNLKDPQGIVHTSFKLTQTRNNAEHLVFSDAAGNLLEDIEIEKTQAEQSRGRLEDGGSEWRIFTTPSPNTSNTGATSAIAFADRPSFDKPAGFYQGSVIIAITTSEVDGVIHYTTDGFEPTLNSPVYTAPITLSQTTVLKAKTYSNNPLILPSFVQFNTYFVDETHTLAVVSVGSNEVLTLANGNQNLTPLGSLEFFDKNGQRKTRAYGELNSHGQDSWANDQRSLDWVTRDEMGYNYALKEKLFPLSERDEFQRIILRASGDDNYPAAHHSQNAGSAHVRDAYVQNLAKRGHLNLDVRISEKCIVYLNGQYWGVYDLREVPDDHDYTDYYYGQGKYDIQYVLTWGNTWAEYGGTQAISDWHSLRSFILNNNMNDPLKFQYVKDHFDYTSLVDYVIVNSFTVCTDWLNYNTGIWRGLNPEGGHQKWGYILWDNDATFDFYINYTGLPSTLANAKPCNPEGLTGGSDPEQHIKVLNKLRTNPEVRQYYLSRQADLMYSVFGCENMLSYLDTIEATIDPEMDRHAQRWFGTYAEWKNNLDIMRDFISNRCTLLPTLMDDCYSVTGPFEATIVVDPPGAGTVKINTLDYNANQFPVTGQYFSGPQVDLLLHATPDTLPATAGAYYFDHWTSKNHAFADASLSQTALDLTTTDNVFASCDSHTHTFRKRDSGQLFPS